MVQRACFHLVSETSASTYAGLSEAERTKVQERIRQLVEGGVLETQGFAEDFGQTLVRVA